MANENMGMDTSDIRRVSPPAQWPIMVMLVDDQPFVAATLRQQLVHEDDINFHYCQDPALAISTAEKIRPTVILLDFVMPEMDGLTLCRFFRAHPATRELPVIMLSSNDDPITKAQAFAAGANDYLVKLPDKIELIARLRYHSNAYISKLQRDDAYRALRASQMKLEELNMHLLRLANRDSLTGIANRRNFDDRFAEEWLRSMRTKHPISLIMFDIDLFKLYNDRFGHLEGDECLKRIAAAAGGIASRPSDVLARYGGEEFVLLLPETDASGAQMLAEKMRIEIEALHIPNPDSSVCQHITISLGVATTVPDADSMPNSDLLIRMADDAMYQAKHAGRNQVSVAPPFHKT